MSILFNKGTKAVEGLSLDVSAENDVILIRTEAFAKLINLRLLKINSLRFSTGSYEKLSKDLRWLCWHRCPLQFLPPNLSLDNLVVLDLRFSNVKKVWKETKFLDKLKVLDLSHSIYLATTPDFARLTSLERLQLEGCTGLTKLHQSIGNLGRLIVLNLAECNNLRELPDNICNLTSLETLNLKGCSRLSKFPAHLGKLEALKRLVADGSTITELPTSFGLLKNLELLSLAGCKEELPANKFFFSFFSSWISPKSVGSRTFLPGTLSNFPILYHLCLKENKFYSLPVGVANHPRIMALALDDCTNLQSIPELPPNLLALKAERCTSLVTFPKLTDIGTKLCFFITTNCPNKDFNEGLDLRYWKPRWHLSWKDGNLSPPFVLDDEVPLKEGVSSPKSKYLEAYFPATEVPDWFEYKEMGSSRLMFCMPLVPNGGRLDMILWVVHGVNEDYDGRSATSLTTFFKNKTKLCRTVDWSFVNTDDKGICQDHAWVSYYMGNHIFGDLEADQGDEIEVSVYGQGRNLVKKYGIYLKPVDIMSNDGNIDD
ncbi:hypothetical protein CCACVL1_04874 [Corchorus capsularis]|uniref:Disease resistance R13L4/SHOC-2-like LRR domain-containing protein n=1 Tax=Corchorus capsularis TaxID=210143 RepID=A0A1R3JP17_COCAP|nr:hypothetical protein CCACVL1_04874 [Corchorus capsularis]